MSDNAQPLRFKSRAQQTVEAKFSESVETLLRRLYVEQELTQEQVARALGVGRQTVIDWMADHDIPTRDRRKVTSEPEAVA